MEEIEKYERKLERAIRKRQRHEEGGDGQEVGGEEERQREKKIQKYEKKIQKARLVLESQSNAAATTSASTSLAGGEVAEIDKSGMTLLLFYAYVEPIWKPAEHAEVMRWAQSTLEGYGETIFLLRILNFFAGVTGRLRVSREGFNGTLTGPYDGIRGFTRDMRSYPGGYFEEMKDGDDFKYTDNLPVGQVPPPSVRVPACANSPALPLRHSQS
jgi:hypothetical protein